MKSKRLARRPISELPAGRVWIIRTRDGWSVIWRSGRGVTFEKFADHKRAIRFADALTWGRL